MSAFSDRELSKLKSIDPSATVPAVAVHLLVDEIRRMRREMQEMADGFNATHRELQGTIAQLRGAR